MVEINYNERSWAIDLISEINSWATRKDVSIKRAGGENTLMEDKNSLFPDVLIYGDERKGKILQGWELKFPDTDISDGELIENAQKKAELLGLNSFVVWNVSVAVLYKINDDHTIVAVRTWNDLVGVTRREEVLANLEETYRLLRSILDEVNGFIETGYIKSSSIIDVLSSDQVGALIQRNLGSYQQSLGHKVRLDIKLENEVNLWWRSVKQDYPDNQDKLFVLARTNLLFLINKFLLAHILKSYSRLAYVVDSINKDTTATEGLNIFKGLSEKVDFWNVFQTLPLEDCLTDEVWQDLIVFNDFLKESKFDRIDQSLLHDLISNTVNRNKRKYAGQFTTPQVLAKLLVALGMEDRAGDTIDPTCGSGTIAKELYTNKKRALGVDKALETTWASDKYAIPLQMATFNMVDPDAIGKVVRVFKQDATTLSTGDAVKLRDPYDGTMVEYELPEFSLVAANLPFVQQEDLNVLNPNVQDINDFIEQLTRDPTQRLDGKTDLLGYLPFYFWKILKANGRVAIIISNSWLGTSWGEKFYDTLESFYDVEIVVTSGNGRWFDNAKVVTNILILRKKDIGSSQDVKTKFVVTRKKIRDYSDEEISELSALINLKSNIHDEEVEARAYSKNEIGSIKKLGLNLNSFFADSSWLIDFSKHLIKASDLFDIARGERRGWDNMFYPYDGSGIEEKYLKPVLKTPRSITNLTAIPDSVAFCCDESLDNLAQLGHTGAYNWIKKFEAGFNGTGIPLPLSLKRANTNWYTMAPNTLADLVTNINFGDRLYFARFDSPTFVNQRLIRFTKKDPTLDIRLCQAILNSTLGLFYLEGMGTGRGEGALDITKDKIEKDLHIVNPGLYSDTQIKTILDAFSQIESREILAIEDELKRADRKLLDRTILEPIGLFDHYDRLVKSLLTLYRLRTSVNQD